MTKIETQMDSNACYEKLIFLLEHDTLLIKQVTQFSQNNSYLFFENDEYGFQN